VIRPVASNRCSSAAGVKRTGAPDLTGKVTLEPEVKMTSESKKRNRQREREMERRRHRESQSRFRM
jgi:hypothetical protein